jgi:hypothetical protein
MLGRHEVVVIAWQEKTALSAVFLYIAKHHALRMCIGLGSGQLKMDGW